MEDFHKWLLEDNKSCLGSEVSKDNFSIFYQNHTFGQNFAEMLHNLAYQVYELQVCMEGMIEDHEF
jgi:hypothetical protein